ncbi:MAG: C10 family peptidase [Bacteroidales bacterium]|nr:C10 family peptidase [Candidatus Scybalocola fimicaballi]
MKIALVLCLVLLSPIGICDAYEYIPNTKLLVRDGYEVKWGQSVNEDNSCSPSYNALCPRTDNKNNVDNCERMLAGCGAIAMAQIMWKWAYPDESKYGIYNWNEIPAVLTDGCTIDCPLLIRNCGDACHMNYQSILGLEPSFLTGSWTTISNIEKGFADFDYSARVVDLDDWKNYGDSWKDLIRSEIDCGRPVLMYGKHNIIEIKEKHYFVIDGYSMTDKNLFHVNWGWRGNKNDYYNLEKCGYSNGQKIIIGIAPKYSGKATYPKITFEQVNIVITPNCPDGENDFVRYKVENADSYECRVYNRSGVKIWASAGIVKNGYADVWDGTSIEKISPTDYWYDVTFKNNHGQIATTSSHVSYLTGECPSSYNPAANFPISFEKISDYVAPICSDESNRYLHLKVKNANSYQCKIYSPSGELLLTNTGDVKGDDTYMWDGSPDSSYPRGLYKYEITFKNYHGASTSTSGSVNYYPYYCPSDFQTDILTTASETNRPVISPNPTDENSTVTSDSKILHIEIFDVSSRLLLSETPKSNSYTIETNGFGKGLYLVRTTTEDGVYVDRLMVK